MFKPVPVKMLSITSFGRVNPKCNNGTFFIQWELYLGQNVFSFDVLLALLFLMALKMSHWPEMEGVQNNTVQYLCYCIVHLLSNEQTKKTDINSYYLKKCNI